MQGEHRLGLIVRGEDTPLELEVGEAVATLGAAGKFDDVCWRQGRPIAPDQPVVGIPTAGGLGPLESPVGQPGGRAVADEEEISEQSHPVPLAAVTEQRGDGHAEVLTEQVKQSGLDRGHRVDGGALVEGLAASAADVALAEATPDFGDQFVRSADRCAEQKRPGLLQGQPDPLAAGNLADPDVARAVVQDQQVADEDRGVRAAQVEQHAVLPGHWQDFGGRHGGRAHRSSCSPLA